MCDVRSHCAHLLALDEYADREQTRSDHLTEAMQALGFRWPGLDDLSSRADRWPVLARSFLALTT